MPADGQEPPGDRRQPGRHADDQGRRQPDGRPGAGQTDQVRGIGRLLVRWAGLPLVWAMTGQFLFLGLFLLGLFAGGRDRGRARPRGRRTTRTTRTTTTRTKPRGRRGRRRDVGRRPAGAAERGAGRPAATVLLRAAFGLVGTGAPCSCPAPPPRSAPRPRPRPRAGPCRPTATPPRSTPTARTCTGSSATPPAPAPRTPRATTGRGPTRAPTPAASPAARRTRAEHRGHRDHEHRLHQHDLDHGHHRPSVFTEIIWFKTTAGYTGGGKLIGFETPRTGVGRRGVGRQLRPAHLPGRRGQGLVRRLQRRGPGHLDPRVVQRRLLAHGRRHDRARPACGCTSTGSCAGRTATPAAEASTGWWRVGCGNLSGWGAEWTGANNPGTNRAVAVNVPFLGLAGRSRGLLRHGAVGHRHRLPLLDPLTRPTGPAAEPLRHSESKTGSVCPEQPIGRRAAETDGTRRGRDRLETP